jgi:flagellar motility protein MotE (MotC chaperone)
MKKVMQFLTMLCVLNVFMVAGLVGYLVGTGRLDKEKGGAIVDLLRHKGTPEKFRETVFDILQPVAATSPSSQPATAPGALAGGQSLKVGASAQERIAFARQMMEQERLSLENEAQELRHRQELLLALQADVQAKLKKIEDTKKESEPKAATAEAKAREENFQKTLAVYDELKTKQVKDIFMENKSPELAASYLVAMDPSRAAKIVGEFKTPAEQQFIVQVLDRIRNRGTGSAQGNAAADMTAAAPAAAPKASAP